MKKKEYVEILLLILSGAMIGVMIELMFQVAGCAPGI